MMPNMQKYENIEYIDNFEKVLFGNTFKITFIIFCNLIFKLKTNCAYN